MKTHENGMIILAISLGAIIALNPTAQLIGDNAIYNRGTSMLPNAYAAIGTLEINPDQVGVERAADAAIGTKYVTIYNDLVAPEEHCEFCTAIEYTPGPSGHAGIAFTSQSLSQEVQDAESVSFYAMAPSGDTTVKFKIGGKSLNSVISSLGNEASKIQADSTFKDMVFEFATADQPVTSDWKKFEVDLSQVDLTGVVAPFGIDINGQDGKKKMIYLKYITYDENAPSNDPNVQLLSNTLEPASSILQNSTQIASNQTGENTPLDRAQATLNNGAVADSGGADNSTDNNDKNITGGVSELNKEIGRIP
jgi:hypothetical protein